MHDCTYAHFADDHTLAARFYPERAVTIYSLSEWLGVAGLRIGAVVAQPDLIERLATAPPNNLGCNVISQRAAIAGLRVRNEWLPEINRRQRRNQAEIAKAVAKVHGMPIAVYPSQANFLVVELIAWGRELGSGRACAAKRLTPARRAGASARMRCSLPSA